ncbi:hypothetical protein FQV37_1058 [Psychrobacter nivimaris]|uniref:Uncharacterized protein n=1 Tax=Psychrobacter nivimaris TaxID=281738 RepID=A0A6N7C5R1_9GAMM|nr:DUF11 domain-containing protein [Psychrobacter nivimaris]KAF0570157.1 hypothetical protein FQV37_1058 [Psychrobacter nivimaris]|tara:strand:- start:60 stop:3167 length:3108 start_codon:yes stop_codon:yes gene_type:complete
MYKAKKPLSIMNPFSFGKYQSQILSLIGFMILSLVSVSSHALVLNDGAAATCPSGSTKGILTNNSYSSLVTSFNSGNYQTVSSQSSTGSSVAIPLKIKMSISDFNFVNKSSVATLTSGNYTAIRFTGSAANSSVRNEILLDFQNSLNNEPLFLNKVALSTFDIDKLSSTNAYWDDNVKFVGTTQNNGTVNGVFQSITGSSVINTNGEGLRLNTDFNCGNTLESTCQGSVVFSEPVKSVKIIYSNTDNDTSTSISSRIIDFRLDSYCYQPSSYEITKDDGVTSIGTTSTTNYIIKVINNGNTPLTNIILKDPIVTGLTKETDITCDTTDNTNTCITAPTKTQLESSSGFNIPSLAVGKTYSIKVPTKVTASQGSTITNTATIKVSNLDLKSASDSNTVTGIFSGGSPVAPASCPSGHKMYYVGSNPPGYTPKETLPIAWTTGSFSKEYVFGNTKFNLSFTERLNLRTGYPTGTNFTDATENAINMYHDSFRTTIDHRLTATINKPVSKYGFVVQDLDSNQNGKYIESITLATSGGFFSKTESKPFQLSNANQTISGTAWDNCNTASPCNFNIDWGYKSALTPFAITHGNPYSEGATTTSAGGYVTGYSDFYFCLAPPKLVVKKVLGGNRVNDSVDSADQFEIKVTGDSLAANSFTTTGNAAIIDNGTSDLLSLTESKTYTISERVINGSVSNYSATYICNNATTGSTFTTTNATATLNEETIPTRSFTLSNLNYGDEITCTITNTPSVYTFTGFVYNDNGGIARSTNPDTKSDTSTTFTGNSKYFNGIFDSGETGIGNTTGLTISLTNCNGVNIGGTTSQTTSDNPLGQYKLVVSASTIAALSPQKVCIVQAEPDPWIFSVDTTPNIRNIDLQAGKLDYKTEGSLNLDFGEVEGDYAALVLRKAQYVNDCRSTLNYTATNINTAGNTDPRAGFSESGISGSDLTPGQCIAYRITATNRANLTINNFVMRDVLQKKGDNKALVTSVLAGVSNASDYANDNVPIGKNGTVKTTEFVLNPKTSRSFYFNTKYGTTMDTQ